MVRLIEYRYSITRDRMMITSEDEKYMGMGVMREK